MNASYCLQCSNSIVRKLSDVQVLMNLSCLHGKDSGMVHVLQINSAFHFGMGMLHLVRQNL